MAFPSLSASTLGLPPSTESIPDLSTSSVLHRDLNSTPYTVTSASGHRLTLTSGRTILDATGGAAVVCLGHNNSRVKSAMVAQMDKVTYLTSMLFSTPAVEDLATELVRGTGGVMDRAYIVSSGSEAVEASMKLARQYFLELDPPQPERVRFISRRQSYHGITLGALGVSGHTARRKPFEPLLFSKEDIWSTVSPCNSYRGQGEGETDAEYVSSLAQELDNEFTRLGPGKVIAFIAESVSGATMGCVPPVPGYFQAIASVVHKHGALLIIDEIMSGMGRCASLPNPTLHHWQAQGIVPDLVTVGKGLSSGYAPVSAVLVNPKVSATLKSGSGTFVHGHTYQAHPLSCAAATETQKIIHENNSALLHNVANIGAYLGSRLTATLLPHPNVGNIRGAGLFWGIEFVADKATKKPFPKEMGVSSRVHLVGLRVGISTYPGGGTVDGVLGDHVLVAPMYDLTREGADEIVRLLEEVIKTAFEGL